MQISKALFCTAIGLAISAFGLFAQDIAVKSNLLVDATLSPHIGVELPLDEKVSAEITGSINAWTLPNEVRKKHWMVMPEVRWWLCDVFGGHFFGIHADGGQYNLGGFKVPFNTNQEPFSDIETNRYQGWFVGAGISYGYAWMLNRHWNIEAEVGVGYIYTEYDKFRCTTCGKKVAEDVPNNYVGPDKAAISLVYIF